MTGTSPDTPQNAGNTPETTQLVDDAAPRRSSAPEGSGGRRTLMALGVAAAVGGGGAGAASWLLGDQDAKAAEEARKKKLTAQPAGVSTGAAEQGNVPADQNAMGAGSGSSKAARPSRKGSPRQGVKVDRDQSYAASTAKQNGKKQAGSSTKPTASTTISPNADGTVPSSEVSQAPGLDSIKTDPSQIKFKRSSGQGPLKLPVADTTEARIHLLRRAGLGMGKAALADMDAKGGMEKWLLDQLSPEGTDPLAGEIKQRYREAYLSTKEVKAFIKAHPGVKDYESQENTRSAVFHRMMFSPRQIFENLCDVFVNTLHVAMPSDNLGPGASEWMNKVIRANALGKYSKMLHESARQPAMLLFFNNNESKRKHVNENYGREILELHSVGVASDYTEAHVVASANILSGRTVREGEYFYDAKEHVLGKQTVLGFTHKNDSAEGGEKVGDEYIQYLAHSPFTARTIARKLAVRFVADVPPNGLVERLAKIYLANDTEIRPMLLELFRSPEFWTATRTKSRRPLEDVVGTIRALGLTAKQVSREGVETLRGNMGLLSHMPLTYGAPNGYADVTAAWESASQMLLRWKTHRILLVSNFANAKMPESLKKEWEPKASGQTLEQWADDLSLRYLGHPASANYKKALAVVYDVKPGTPSKSALSHDSRADLAVCLLFDSPEFMVR